MAAMLPPTGPGEPGRLDLSSDTPTLRRVDPMVTDLNRLEREAADRPAPVGRVAPADRPRRGAGVDEALPIGLDDLFFSTTDDRGVIITGNSVFSRLSGWPLDRLVGSPHNIVRHPDMPAGVFSLMWDRLHAGLPMAGYVLNLARDGRAYWVFATIIPHGEGYLSVRVSPVSPYFRAAAALYGPVRDQERAARAAGRPAASVARLGASLLAEGLQQAGFERYDDFMAEALPAEVSARAVHAGARIATLQREARRRPDAGPVADVLVAAAQLDGLLDGLVSRLEAYHGLTRELLDSAWAFSQAAGTAGAAVQAARRAARTLEHEEPAGYALARSGGSSAGRVLGNVAAALTVPADRVVDALHRLAGSARAASTAVSDLRVRLSLARLQTEMVVVFAGELLQGPGPTSWDPARQGPDAAGAGAGADQMPALCDAVHAELRRVGDVVAGVDAHLVQAGDAADGLAEQFNEFRRLVGMWRILALRHHVADRLEAAVQPVDAMLDGSHDHLQALVALGGRCRTAVIGLDHTGFDARRAEGLLLQMRSAAGQLRG